MDAKYDKLKIGLDKIEDSIKTYIAAAKGNLSIERKPNNLSQFIVEIPGQERALLNVYDKSNGISINPNVGKNPGLSIKIADMIVSSSDKVISKTRTFMSILGETFGQFKEYLKEEEILISQQADDGIKTMLKLSRGKSELTVTWYKTSHKFLMQGLTTSLWDDVSLWFAGKIKEDPIEIVRIVYDDYEKFTGYQIKCSDALLDKLLKEQLDQVYDNRKILRDEERKWLKTSCLLCEMDIELPEYYPVISSSLKVVEGILRRICINKFGLTSFNPTTGGFQHFEESPRNGGEMILKNGYKQIIRDPDGIVYIEELYKYIRTRRNIYQHNPGAGAAIIEKKDKAKELFAEVIIIIKKSGKFEKVLF